MSKPPAKPIAKPTTKPPQVLIAPLLAVSVTNQADMIKALLAEKNIPSTYKNKVSIQDIQSDKNRAFLWFTLATLRFSGDAVWPYIACKKPKAFYTTVEGIPTKAHTLCSNLPKIDFIANSEFTKKSLEQAGLQVSEVIHHGIDWEKCQRLRKDSELIKKKWEGEFKDRVKFLYVGRNDPRKGLDLLERAIGMVNETMPDKVVFLLFTEGNLDKLDSAQNVVRVGTVNSLPYDQVLRLIGGCDYFLFPTVCEGFGLPLLEANAMGKPAIHCWMPPLSEFSSKDFNFVYGYYEERLVNCQNMQYWIFHTYRPELLAEMITEAVRVFKENKAQYDEFCIKAAEHTKAWDYHKVYGRLLERLEC
jgi:glycosyltransferase involved in cell wall biosynthesis